MFLCAWALALTFWLHSYSVEIGSNPIFFGAYAVAGIILVTAQVIYISSATTIAPVKAFEIWSEHHPDEFSKLAQEYEDGGFTVFSDDIGKILKRGHRQK